MEYILILLDSIHLVVLLTSHSGVPMLQLVFWVVDVGLLEFNSGTYRKLTLQWCNSSSASINAGKTKDFSGDWPTSFYSIWTLQVTIMGSSVCTCSSLATLTGYSSTVYNHAASSSVTPAIRVLGIGRI